MLPKKVSILSEDDDISTDDVIDWLIYFGADVIRINEGDIIQKIAIRISDLQHNCMLQTSFDDTANTLDSEQISSMWYRRGDFSITDNILKNDRLRINNSNQNHINFLTNEIDVIKHYLYDFFYKEKRGINSYTHNYTNKLWNLKIASEASLNIPDTLVTNNAEELKIFASKHKEIIIKPLNYSHFKIAFEGSLFEILSRIHVITYEELIAKLDNENIDTFLPTLFQGYIDKRYEIRCFYLNKNFYSMAIFSQQNEKTKRDFRNYDHERPNRCIPFKLPKEIEFKLIAFMDQIDMNCGSFDIIRTPTDEYVFLEVNPIGQFQWLSHNCNYYIEKIIAETLIHERP